MVEKYIATDQPKVPSNLPSGRMPLDRDVRLEKADATDYMRDEEIGHDNPGEEPQEEEVANPWVGSGHEGSTRQVLEY